MSSEFEFSEQANETGHVPVWNLFKFIDHDPLWYTRRVKEAIHIRLHPNIINRDGGIEVTEAWLPTIKKHGIIMRIEMHW